MSPELHDALVDLMVRRPDIQLAGAPLVAWAIHALEEGAETDSLIYLAGLSLLTARSRRRHHSSIVDCRS